MPESEWEYGYRWTDADGRTGEVWDWATEAGVRARMGDLARTYPALTFVLLRRRKAGPPEVVEERADYVIVDADGYAVMCGNATESEVRAKAMLYAHDFPEHAPHRAYLLPDRSTWTEVARG